MTHLPDVLYYDAPFNLYGIAFSQSSQHPSRVALTSFQSTSTNKLQIIDVPSVIPSSSPFRPQSYHPLPSSNDFEVLATTNLTFPPTKVAFEPKPGGSSTSSGNYHGGNTSSRELIATTGDVLRIWELVDSEGGGGGNGNGNGMDMDGDEEMNRYGRGGYVGNVGWGGETGGSRYSLKERSKLSNSKSPPTNLPPLTSFSWNPHSPQSIVTCSIDTTATVWDISTSTALTQLIAHDREVYDVSWLPSSSDVFVSVGADGSLRAFDLRSLEHSTILYETKDNRALARIAFGQKEQHYLTTFGMGDEKALVLDMRSPGVPVVELSGHRGALGAIGWGGESGAAAGGGGWVATCGDDSQLLLYDLTQPLPFPQTAPENSSSRPPTKDGTSHPSSTSTSTVHPTPTNHKSTSTLPPPSRSNTNTNNNNLRPLATPGSTTSTTRAPSKYPSMTWNSPGSTGEINNLAWGKEWRAEKGSGQRDGCWLGAVSGKRLSCLRF